MKNLFALLLLAGSLQICSAQQQYNPPVRWLSGTGVANPGECNAVGLGAFYEQIGDPASFATRISACVQTGSSSYAWQPTAYKVQTAAPAVCNVGEVWFDSDATAGSNWFGCTSANTWTLLGGGGSGTVTVVGAGSLTSGKCVTGGGSQTIQTPSTNCSVDSSGNLSANSFAGGSSPPTCTAGTGGPICVNEGTAPSAGPASGVDVLYADSTAHCVLGSFNNDSYKCLLRSIASGSQAMGTSAISGNACATTITATATGATTSGVGSRITWTATADISTVTGYGYTSTDGLKVYVWPTANNVNFKVCNGTASSITPGAVTFNWLVQ